MNVIDKAFVRWNKPKDRYHTSNQECWEAAFKAGARAQRKWDVVWSKDNTILCDGQPLSKEPLVYNKKCYK